MELVLFISSVLPVIIISYYIYKKDKDKEPLKLLIKLLLAGVFSTVLTILISDILEIFIPMFRLETQQLNIFQLFIYTFIKIALVEEFSKWIMTYKITFYNRNFDEIYDMIIYSIFVALGFAGLENLLYVYNYGLLTAVIRAIISVPGHACFGLFMGYYLGLAKISELNSNKKLAQKNKLLSIVVPMSLHGVFDYLLFFDDVIDNNLMKCIALLLFIIFVVIVFVKAFKKIQKINNVTGKILSDNKYCVNCGKEIKYEFCTQCGKKNEK